MMSPAERYAAILAWCFYSGDTGVTTTASAYYPSAPTDPELKKFFENDLPKNARKHFVAIAHTMLGREHLG